MLILLKFIVFLYYIGKAQTKQTYYWQKYYEEKNANEAPTRILQLMRSYYEENHARVAALNPMRFMYEESPYYEQGYVVSELLERYRKLVETSQRVFTYNSDTFYHTLKRVEWAQRLYFEIYHLVRMMHETPKKWQIEPEFFITEQIRPKGMESAALSKVQIKGEENTDGPSQEDLERLKSFQNVLDVMAKKREKNKKMKRKIYKQIRETFLTNVTGKMNYSDIYKHMQKKYNVQWPIDYGWEIDYEW
ncbi:uncharacterized protein LOC111361353 isoform X1 [Spodoptera litura]|uniref:Uncharacterized protein LOC111361353 isoform X1 n=2 Tax=Spodoptera litura TaxID=69820 RepID=A0A9J7EMU0_SPOLT|nr:uncharacterized protein LOC111361353 isoform X1 [Spodoptera litura]